MPHSEHKSRTLIERGIRRAICLRSFAPFLWPLAIITFVVLTMIDNSINGSVTWFTPKKIAMVLIWAWAIFAFYRPDFVLKWLWKLSPIKLHPNCTESFQVGLEKIRRKDRQKTG